MVPSSHYKNNSKKGFSINHKNKSCAVFFRYQLDDINSVRHQKQLTKGISHLSLSNMSLQQSKCRRGSHCHDVVLLVLWLHWFIVPVYRLNFSPLFFFKKKKSYSYKVLVFLEPVWKTWDLFICGFFFKIQWKNCLVKF